MTTLAPLALKDARIYYATLDATGFANKISLDDEYEDLDKTTFGSGGARERVSGLADMAAGATIFWQAGDLSYPDDVFWANLGANTQPLTVCPTAGTVGSVAYLTKVFQPSWKPGGDIGKLLAADVTWSGNQPLARGAILHPQGTARTATGNGTGVQVGAILAAQSLYANLHVFSVGAGAQSLTVKLQSSVDNTFGSPTDRVTFTAATGLTAECKSVAGAVTDTWWRVVYTITGSTPSFLFAVSAGVA